MATKGGDEMSHETTVRQRFPEAVCEPAYEGWGGQRMVFYIFRDKHSAGPLGRGESSREAWIAADANVRKMESEER